MLYELGGGLLQKMDSPVNYKQLIAGFAGSNDIKLLKKIKIAILSSYTINNILEPLVYRLYVSGFNPEVRFGGFDQYLQDIIDESSWLRSFDPDLVFICISARTFFKDLEFNLEDEGKKKLYHEKAGTLVSALENFELKSKVIVTTLDYPAYSPYGINDAVHENGMASFVHEFNRKLVRLARQHQNILLLDFEKVCSAIGYANISDDKMYYLGKMLLNNKAADMLSSEFAKFANAVYGNVKKCLVVDMDNTLWGGIIGEDGPDGIIIDDSNIGMVYQDVQKIILNLKKKGILVAAVSKNNPEDAMPAFNKNGMILREKDFIIKKINWKDKSENIRKIAQELNIGLDSMVFLDDNPAERLEVKNRLPMVEVIDFPADIALLPRVLMGIPFFESVFMTKEDLKRHEMYEHEKKREELKKSLDVNDYLFQLGIEIKVKKDDIRSLARITQLINKTNQFNLTTKRYTDEEVRHMINSDDFQVTSAEVSDKFGDMGLTGVIIIKIMKDYYYVDSFLVSCRILSRKIENQFFIESLNCLKDKGKAIKAEYIPTTKNSLVRDWYDNFGFRLISETKGVKKYESFFSGLNLDKIGWIEVDTSE